MAKFCTECGEGLPDGAKFCASCGARVAVADPPAPPPEPETPAPPAPEPEPAADPSAEEAVEEGDAERSGARERFERVAPGADELAARVAEGLRRPSVAAAGIAAAAAAGAVLVFGLIVAALFPTDSIIGSIGLQGSFIEEGLRQAVGTLLIPFGDPGVRVAPTLFALVPVGAMAAATAWQSSRTTGRTPRARLLAGAAAGIPFALIMLLFALVSGDAEPQLGATLLAGLFWGGLGGALGAWLQVRKESAAISSAGVPARAAEALAVAAAALRPLALALLATTAIGIGVWMVQTLRDPAPARGERSPALALAENSLYAVEHGVNFFALGTLSAFDATNGQVAIPVDSREDVFDESDAGRIRVFAYRDAISAPLYLPLLLVLIALPAGAALLAGFAVARTRGAKTPVEGAAWGAITGPIWAIVGTLFASIATREAIFGTVSGGSLFGLLLLGGAVLGGLGGFLAVRAAAPAPAATEEQVAA